MGDVSHKHMKYGDVSHKHRSKGRSRKYDK